MVESGGLLNRCTDYFCTAGSNPVLSVVNKSSVMQFVLREEPAESRLNKLYVNVLDLTPQLLPLKGGKALKRVLRVK